MLKQALEYIHKGWHVFPCSDKIPATKNGYKDATISPDKVKQYFKNGNYNIAVATGSVSGFFVLDVDVKNDRDGNKVIHDLEYQHGKLPQTRESITWSGGRHLYFKYPKDRTLRCKANLYRGIDVRGNGGYVILPESIIDDRRYVWRNEIDIAEAPEWLLDIVSKKKKEIVTETAYLTEGKRNDVLAKEYGMRLRKMGLSQKEIFNSLQSINQERCQPPLSEDEVKLIARSMTNYDGDEIRIRDEFGEDIEQVCLSEALHAKHHNRIVKISAFILYTAMVDKKIPKIIKVNNNKIIEFDPVKHSDLLISLSHLAGYKCKSLIKDYFNFSKEDTVEIVKKQNLLKLKLQQDYIFSEIKDTTNFIVTAFTENYTLNPYKTYDFIVKVTTDINQETCFFILKAEKFNKYNSDWSEDDLDWLPLFMVKP